MSKDFDWSVAIEVSERLFEKDCCSVSSDFLIVRHKKKIVFLMQKKEENDYVSMHLRAGLLPNAAAWISSSLFVNMDFVLGENFEFDSNKDILYGIDALKYAANNIHEFWDLSTVDEKVEPKYDGVLRNLTPPKGTKLN